MLTSGFDFNLLQGSDIFFGNLEADDDLDLAISLSIKVQHTSQVSLHFRILLYCDPLIFDYVHPNDDLKNIKTSFTSSLINSITWIASKYEIITDS